VDCVFLLVFSLASVFTQSCALDSCSGTDFWLTKWGAADSCLRPRSPRQRFFHSIWFLPLEIFVSAALPPSCSTFGVRFCCRFFDRTCSQRRCLRPHVRAIFSVPCAVIFPVQLSAPVVLLFGLRSCAV
jgi:hypothetical protein